MMAAREFLSTFAALPAADQRTWAGGALLVLVVMALLLLLESRVFRPSGRAISWAKLRLLSLGMAPVTFAAVVMPARAVSGMEGLAVFYLCLFTIGPLLWFGSHLGLARRLRPALSGGEAAMLATSALAILAIPATVAMLAQGPWREAQRSLAGRPTPGAVPLAHRATPVLRRSLPGAGVLFTQSLLAPPGVAIERIERRFNGPWFDTGGLTQTLFCRHGEDLHLMWSAQEPAPQLRLHWKDGAGSARTGEHRAAGAPRPAEGDRGFAVGWRADGVDPEAPIPRSRAYFVLARPDGSEARLTPEPPRAGQEAHAGCLMAGDVQPGWRNIGRPRRLGIVFQPISPAPPAHAVIAFEAAAAESVAPR